MKTLKESMKKRDIDLILGHHSCKAMSFMVNQITEKELLEDRKICKKEIEKRIKKSLF